MAVAWQEFERLVARIEQSLAPGGAVVTSPDFVTDLVTGSRRQIDATIRFKIGTVPILITAECRRHEDVQDDTWLEQVAMKKQKVGAAKTIAVSSSGFTGPAKTTAARFGVEVRTVDEITPEDIRAWLKIDGIVQVVDRTELVSFRWGVYGTPTQLHPDVARQMEADPAGAPVFRQLADGRQLCIRDLVAVAQEQGLKLHEGLPHDGTRRRHEVRVHFPVNTVSILTTNGPRSLSEVRLGVEAFCEGTVQPLPAGFDYSDTKDSLARGIEHRPDIPGHDCIVTLLREPNSAEVKVNVAIRKKPGRDEATSPAS